MSEQHNVGRVDGGLRIALGIGCVALFGYHFVVARVLPLYAVVAVLVLVPFFLKTGVTRICPVMKAMGVSTNR